MRWPWSRRPKVIFWCDGCRDWRPREGAQSISLYGSEIVRCATCSMPITPSEAREFHAQLNTMSEEQLKTAIAGFTPPQIW